MSNSSGKATVISLGGSLITTEPGIDQEFLQEFSRVIRERIPERTFYIITGGGSTARTYQQALQSVADPSDEDLDWMGIHSTRLNGQLLRLMFADTAHEELVLTPEAAAQTDESVVIGAAGATPGRSSDYGSLVITEAVGADHLIELSDISHIYSADPKSNPDAEAFDQLTWEKYRGLIPDDWQPGLHVPFDPYSARYAQKNDIEVAIMGGDVIDNFTDYLDSQQFTGTKITTS